MRLRSVLLLIILVRLCVSLAYTDPGCQPIMQQSRRVALVRESMSERGGAVDGGFKDFCVVDKSNVWAIGIEGELGAKHCDVALSSSDGGHSWERKLTRQGETFLGIFFVSPTTGWVVGADTLILKSVDGGQTWFRQKAPIESSFVKVLFFNEYQGWVLGNDGTLLTTQDGGEHWIDNNTKATMQAGWVDGTFKGWLNALSFGDQLNGWVVGEHCQVYNSTDGGLTWVAKEIHLPASMRSKERDDINFLAVVFFNSRTGFMIAEIAGNRPESIKRIVIFKTTSGGGDWVVAAEISNTGVSRVQFIDPNEIWIAVDQGAYLLRSTNGGINWTRVQFPSTGIGWPLMYFLDPHRGWIVSSVSGFSMNGLYTVNGGKRWKREKIKYSTTN